MVSNEIKYFPKTFVETISPTFQIGYMIRQYYNLDSFDLSEFSASGHGAGLLAWLGILDFTYKSYYGGDPLPAMILAGTFIAGNTFSGVNEGLENCMSYFNSK